MSLIGLHGAFKKTDQRKGEEFPEQSLKKDDSGIGEGSKLETSKIDRKKWKRASGKRMKKHGIKNKHCSWG